MKKTWKYIIITLVLCAIIALGYFVMKWLGFESPQDLAKTIDDSLLGTGLFVLLLILQVIFLPAGTLLFSGAAVLIFSSPLKAWLLCWFSLTIGSWIMFWIGRIFGTKVMKWLVGNEKAEKYAKFLSKGKFILPLILLIPIFPDDVICLAAGFSKINWVYFMITIFITRGIDNFCTVFVGSVMLQSTVGIILLIIFIIAMLIVAYFLTKYQENIENFILQKLTRKKNTNLSNTNQLEEKKDIEQNQERTEKSNKNNKHKNNTT